MGRPKKEVRELENIPTSKLNESKKEINIWVDKGISVIKFQENKIPFSETEPDFSISEEEAFNLYCKEMSGRKLRNRLKIISNTLGKKYPNGTPYNVITMLYELLPYICTNLHLIILGDKGTGKTSNFTAYTNDPFVYFEAPTAADLRGSKITNDSIGKTPALSKNILCFDEVSDYNSNEIISILKSFESGNTFLAQGNIPTKSTCSIVLCGNVMNSLNNFKEIQAKKLMSRLPRELSDEAFLNRQTGVLYHMAIPPLKISSFLDSRETALNVNIFLKALVYLKKNSRKLKKILFHKKFLKETFQF